MIAVFTRGSLGAMSEDAVSHEQVLLANSLARMARIKRLLEPGHILFATEEHVLVATMRAVHGAEFQYVLDNYRRIAADHHVEYSEEGLRPK